jgi:hypothetical protein
MIYSLALDAYLADTQVPGKSPFILEIESSVNDDISCILYNTDKFCSASLFKIVMRIRDTSIAVANATITLRAGRNMIFMTPAYSSSFPGYNTEFCPHLIDNSAVKICEPDKSISVEPSVGNYIYIYFNVKVTRSGVSPYEWRDPSPTLFAIKLLDGENRR